MKRHNFRRLRGTNVLNFIIYGLLFDIVINLWKPFSVKFLERLGGGSLEIALLNSLPGLVAAAVLIPGAVLLARLPDKKKTTAVFILLSRTLLLAIACIPMLPAPMRPMLFVILVAVMNCPDALSQTSLQSVLGIIFDGNIRGQAIALRNKFGPAAVPLITLSTGLIITYIPSTEAQRMFLYQLFFAGAFAIGLLEAFVFNRFKMPAAEQKPENPGKDRVVNIGGIFKDKTFRAFFLPILFFAFFWQAGWPLFAVYQVVNLQANELWFAIFALISGFTTFASAGFWQRWMRKRSNTATLILSAATLALNAFVLPLCPNVYIMALLCPIGGFSAIGINTAMLNGVLGATPEEGRLVYLAFYNTALNISLFIAPIFSHTLLIGFGVVNALHIVGACRLAAAGVIFLARLKGKKSI